MNSSLTALRINISLGESETRETPANRKYVAKRRFPIRHRPPSATHRTETKMASMTSSLVGQRLTVKTNKAVKARNVQVKAMAAKPKVITKAADLRLIGKAVTAAEELGLLGIADGISLASIEKAGLLSTAEKVIYDRNSPGTISTLGLVLAAAGAGAVYAIPDETTTEIVLQVVVASACAVGFGVSLTASSLLRKLQN